MSVLIKGMEMPENCFECPCCRHDSVDGIKMEQCNLTLDSFDANYFERWNSRAQNCPLFEVKTPHGNLVDREKLIAEYDRQHVGPPGGARKIMEQATAVIKAEEMK